MTNPQLARHFEVSLTSVRTKCYELGLKRMELEYWTVEQVKFLRKNYKKIGDVEMAEIFEKKWPKQKGWTLKHIEKKRKYLKLKRTEKQIGAIFRRNKAAGRFKFCPVNRWIQQGVFPEGTIRTWVNDKGKNKFKVIKVNGVYHHYARWLYTRHFGAMKKGFVIGFKDGDNMNVTVENIEAITRAEHAIRNRTGRRKYPEDLREVMQLLSQLNQLIKIKSET